MIIFQQASAIPFRVYEDKLQILLIKSRNGKKWIVPKGIIEEGDSAISTAMKETEEEAGAVGIVKKGKLGSYEYNKWDGKCKVKVFAMEVKETLDEWEEMHFRERKWESSQLAIQIVKPKPLQKILKKFVKSFNHNQVI